MTENPLKVISIPFFEVCQYYVTLGKTLEQSNLSNKSPFIMMIILERIKPT